MHPILQKLHVVEVCAGIGGISRGFEMTGGFETVAFVEIDSYARQVLKKHWPDVPQFCDVRRVSAWTLPACDVLAGGIPCQPHSLAGKRKGSADERDLWPDFYRLICEIRPKYAVVENVPGLRSSDSGRFFAGILRDLAQSGYDAEWVSLSVADVGGPSLRERLFIVAYPASERLDMPQVFTGSIAETRRKKQESRAWSFVLSPGHDAKLRPIPDTGIWGVATGISNKVDLQRIKCIGNAVSPPVAAVIGDFILRHTRTMNDESNNIPTRSSMLVPTDAESPPVLS